MKELDKKRVELFLKYIDKYGLIKKENKVKFSDIANTGLKDRDLYGWFNYQIHSNPDSFLRECEKYKEEYPNAYAFVCTKYAKISLRAKSDIRVELFMEYINAHDIPTRYKDLRFCEISPNFCDDSSINSWLQRSLVKGDMNFLAECKKYEDKYPIGYAKIKLKVDRRAGLDIFKERVKVIVRYLNDETKEINSTLLFCDLGEEVVDNVLVDTWIRAQFLENFSKFVAECTLYKDIYQVGFLRMNKMFTDYQSHKLNLSFAQRFKLFMKYVEENDVPLTSSKLTFKDIDFEVSDVSKVGTWMALSLSTKYDKFVTYLDKYKPEYPLAFVKVKQRCLIYDMASRKLRVNQYDKLRAFLEYYDSNPLVNKKDGLMFKDIIPGVNDETIVWNWFIKRLASDLDKFVRDCSRYQKEYPNAYEQICYWINRNPKRLRTARIRLIEELYKIKANLESSEEFKTSGQKRVLTNKMNSKKSN